VGGNAGDELAFVLEKGSKQRVLLHLVKLVVANLYDPVDITRLCDLPGEVCSAHKCAVQSAKRVMGFVSS
jgi:hypothetical protein